MEFSVPKIAIPTDHECQAGEANRFFHLPIDRETCPGNRNFLTTKVSVSSLFPQTSSRQYRSKSLDGTPIPSDAPMGSPPPHLSLSRARASLLYSAIRVMEFLSKCWLSGILFGVSLTPERKGGRERGRERGNGSTTTTTATTRSALR